MSAQPVEPPTGPQQVQASAAAEVHAQIAASPEAERWLPQFEQEWAGALTAARTSYSLAPVQQVIVTWRMRLATAPAVRLFVASGYDDADAVPLTDVLGPKR